MFNEIKNEILDQFPYLDAFINTACPRIFINETEIYSKPVITIDETLVMLDKIKWEELLQKGWFIKDKDIEKYF